MSDLERSLVVPSATAEEAQTQIIEWFTNLRSKGHLLSTTEFESFSKSDFKVYPDPARLLGVQCLQRGIDKLGLKKVKVPEAYLVVDENVNEVDIQLHGRIGLIFPQIQKISGYGDTVVSIQDRTLTLYSRLITAVDRVPTRDEIKELLLLAQETHYWDLYQSNFIIAEDGIYIIDTEFRNFVPLPPFLEMRRLASLLTDQSDIDWTLAEIRTMIDVYCQNHPEADWSNGNNPRFINYEHCKNKTFQVSFQSLFKSEVKS